MSRGSRWRFAVCVLAVLLGGGWGCHPTGSTDSAPTTTKPDKQPDNKDQPAKPPKPSVG